MKGFDDNNFGGPAYQPRERDYKSDLEKVTEAAREERDEGEWAGLDTRPRGRYETLEAYKRRRRL